MTIYQTIAAIMKEIAPIAKDKRNKEQGFAYRGIDDVMNELQPRLAAYKCFIVPDVVESTRSERQTKSGGTLFYSILKVKYTFYADDGSFVTAVVIGEGMDSGDKASNKALSAAFKYACFQVFCIPTEDMTDGDAESPAVANPVQKPDAPSNDNFVMLKSALIDYINAGAFEHPENVEMVIGRRDIPNMRKAIDAAKAREAAKEAK